MWSKLALQAGTAVASGVGSGVGNVVGEYAQRGLDKAFGIDRKAEQVEQQRKLTDVQGKENERLMNVGNTLQKEMWDYTNFENQVKHLRQAGLNPALLYSSGGGGGVTGTSSSSVGGSQASDEASMLMSRNAQTAMGLQMQKTASEIEVNKSIAEANRSKAGLDESKTTTENEQRNYLIGKLREEGVYYWIQNEISEMKLKGDSKDEISVLKNKFLDRVLGINGNSWAQQEIANAVLKTMAETENIDANKLLLNERAKAIWKELLIAQQNADSNTVNAKARELATNWGTGEYKNWKTWVDLGLNGLKTITSVIK